MPFIDIWSAAHKVMIARKVPSVGLQYRKRPEPSRVVSFESLRRIQPECHTNDGQIVSYRGVIDESKTWGRVPTSAINIEISERSMRNLHNRMISSSRVYAEVA